MFLRTHSLALLLQVLGLLAVVITLLPESPANAAEKKSKAKAPIIKGEIEEPASATIPESTPAANAPQVATTASGNFITLGQIDGESDGKTTVLSIRFNGKPSWNKVEQVQDHGSFLQLTLPSTFVPEPGKFYDGNNGYLPKIAVFQLTPSDAAIRLFANKDAAKIKQALTAAVLGNRIVITLDNAKIDAAVAAAAVANTAANQLATAATAPATAATAPATAATPPAVAALTAPAQDFSKSSETEFSTDQFVGPPAPAGRPAEAAAIIAKTDVKHDQAPADLVKKDNAKTTKLTSGGIDVRDKLVKVAAFFGILLLMMGLSWFARPLMRRRSAARAGLPEAGISMKTLATMQLAARQKVSLIQVGDERILIGVTPDNVSFLTTMGRSPHQAQRPYPEVHPSQNLAPAAAMPAFNRLLESRGNHLDGQQNNAGSTVDLYPAPTLKNIPGNDPESLRDDRPDPGSASNGGTPRSSRVGDFVKEARRQTATKTGLQPESSVRPRTPSPEGAPVSAAKAKRAAGNRINVSVGEDGVQDHGARPPNRRTAADGGPESVDDVTRLIREKLKSLRNI